MDGIFSRIDSLIDEYESKMVEDTIKLVNIKSVRSEPIPGAPFGEGSRKVLDTANSVTGENGKPFVMSGGTYAYKLPNAYVYGTGANVPPPDFEKGQGCCHGRDEAASIQRLKRLMRVYGRTFIKLDGRI